MSVAELPIDALGPALAEHVRQQTPCLVLTAPTGSGKSTRVPAMLLDQGAAGEQGQILVLQPRRLAARMLARRVASERGGSCGGETGYQVRFDNRTGPETRLIYVTEGILLRRLQADPDLGSVGVLVFDEFHERHLDADLGLALARQLQLTRRPDLRIVVMSATLDAEPVAAWLDDAPILRSEGRQFPVDVRYAGAALSSQAAPIWDRAATACADLAAGGLSGDILVFMPGGREIRRTLDALAVQRALRGWDCLPLYGDLPPEAQDAAVAGGGGRRRVIVATNVAETSLTIPGVAAVVDSGLVRQARFDPQRGINTLLTERISRASADQRAGRAGRLGPGLAVRLWNEAEHRPLPVQTDPEIHRMDLAEVLLGLGALGLPNLGADLAWFEAPDADAWERARQCLADLGAIRPDGSLTALGERMAAFPQHPRYARLFLEASDRHCLPLACLIAGIMQGRGLLLPRPDKATERRREEAFPEIDAGRSDLLVALDAWVVAREHRFQRKDCDAYGIHGQAAREAGRAADQFAGIARELDLPGAGESLDSALACRSELAEPLQRSLLAAFIDHLARRDRWGTLTCALIHGRRARLAPDSVVRQADLVVAADVQERAGPDGVKIQLGAVTAVEPAWLQAIDPEGLQTATGVVWDAKTRSVVAREERRFRDLVLEAKDRPAEPGGETARLLAEAVQRDGLVLKRWDAGVEAWIDRVNFVAETCPAAGISPIDEAGRQLLLETLCADAIRYKDIKDKPVWPVLEDWLGPGQAPLLDHLAPESLVLPGRKRPFRIRYGGDRGPTLQATVQDLYDVPADRLRIADGAVPLTIEILAPNRRPIQITQDLAGFWANSYPQVKKDLKGRYPKHEWR
ncbi:MAG: ATP-dependent helicase HrpB [Opitutales bacterium]